MPQGSGDVGNAGTLSREALGRRSRRNNFKVKIIFHLSKPESKILYQAILPEARDVPSRRASVNLHADPDKLILEISAVDPVALRAALNSFLRFIDSSLQILRQLSS